MTQKMLGNCVLMLFLLHQQKSIFLRVQSVLSATDFLRDLGESLTPHFCIALGLFL